MGVLRRVPHRRLPLLRATDQRELVKLCGVGDRRQISDEFIDGGRERIPGRHPVAAHVVSDHSVGLAQPGIEQRVTCNEFGL